LAINCPQCGHEASEGDVQCSQCGAQLALPGGEGTLPVRMGDVGGRATSELPGTSGLPYLEDAEARVILQVVRTGQVLPLSGSGEFIIGRVSEGQSILPDIDMEPFEGFEAGVSRLHARIRVSDNEVSLVDLGSSNGTRLNNENLMPNQPQPLKHKDLIRLGRMSLQVLIREA
jgi:hypothetical protein